MGDKATVDAFYDRRWPGAEVPAVAIVDAAVALLAGLRLIARVEDRLTERV